MQKPTLKELEAVLNLRVNKDFQEFFKWVNRSLVSGSIDAISIEKEPQRTWAQGRCQELKELIDTVQKAPEIQDKIKSAEKG